jgi:hypothetical protein
MSLIDRETGFAPAVTSDCGGTYRRDDDLSAARKRGGL